MDREPDRRTARECCTTFFVVYSLQYSTSRASRQRCEGILWGGTKSLQNGFIGSEKPERVVKSRRKSPFKNIPFQNTAAVGLVVAEVPVGARPPTRPILRPTLYTLSGRPWTGRRSRSPPDDRSGTGWRRRCRRDRGCSPTSFYRGPRRPPDTSCLVASSIAKATAAGRPSAAPLQVYYHFEYYTVSYSVVPLWVHIII